MYSVDDVTENEDYVLGPSPLHEQSFEVLLTTGTYKDCVIVYHEIQYNGATKEIAFEMELVEEPEGQKIDIDNPDLQKYASVIVQDIINNLAEKKQVLFLDVETGKQIDY